MSAGKMPGGQPTKDCSAEDHDFLPNIQRLPDFRSSGQVLLLSKSSDLQPSVLYICTACCMSGSPDQGTTIRILTRVAFLGGRVLRSRRLHHQVGALGAR